MANVIVKMENQHWNGMKMGWNGMSRNNIYLCISLISVYTQKRWKS